MALAIRPAFFRHASLQYFRTFPRFRDGGISALHATQREHGVELSAWSATIDESPGQEHRADDHTLSGLYASVKA